VKARFEGRVWCFGDDIDTDAIIPARYLNTSSPAELAAHCMEDADPDFPGKVREGDIIVAGKNFGPHCCEGSRHFLCYCGIVRAYLLPQCHKYRASHSGVPGSGGEAARGCQDTGGYRHRVDH